MATGYEVKAYHDLHAIAVALTRIANVLDPKPKAEGKPISEFFPMHPEATDVAKP